MHIRGPAIFAHIREPFPFGPTFCEVFRFDLVFFLKYFAEVTARCCYFAEVAARYCYIAEATSKVAALMIIS